MTLFTLLQMEKDIPNIYKKVSQLNPIKILIRFLLMRHTLCRVGIKRLERDNPNDPTASSVLSFVAKKNLYNMNVITSPSEFHWVIYNLSLV